MASSSEAPSSSQIADNQVEGPGGQIDQKEGPDLGSSAVTTNSTIIPGTMEGKVSSSTPATNIRQQQQDQGDHHQQQPDEGSDRGYSHNTSKSLTETGTAASSSFVPEDESPSAKRPEKEWLAFTGPRHPRVGSDYQVSLIPPLSHPEEEEDRENEDPAVLP